MSKLASGDKCPKCSKGRMRVRTSRRVGDSQVQQLDCNQCDHKAEGKVVVPATSVWSRSA